MNHDATKILNLMFREGESVCVSHNKFAYHSIPFKQILGADQLTMVPTPSSCDKRGIAWEERNFERVDVNRIGLVALNPINGFREDANCISFRNFLVDLDYGSLDQQLAYIRHLDFPLSAITFTGGRGYHVLISLDTDLQSEEEYRTLAQWFLNIATVADQNCKNPSRSMRLAGSIRDNGNEQTLVEYRGVVRLTDFKAWLEQYPESKPRVHDPIERSEIPDPSKLSGWVRKQLRDGLDFKNGRNKTWFSLACDFAKAGFSIEDTTAYLEGYFCSERDFTRREWSSAIQSAFKFIYKQS